ncbi:MAG: isoprenyl transferase [Bacteroidales bacterium]|jgi:undecaprenyl diphosphate synthase|nr:isoprenyl transferase [Bacteroidales bacterium]
MNLDEIDKNKLPSHVAIIMDGNGRWAKNKSKSRLVGHQKGAETVDEIVTVAAELQISYMTLYAFSTENWHRPQPEVSGLMDLLVNMLNKYIKKLHDNNIRLLVIGETDSLPPKTRKKLADSIKKLQQNTGLTLILALSYSSRWEITEMVKSVAQECLDSQMNVKDINQHVVSQFLCTKNIPDPELLIRTSGEYRISNFLLWQLAYTEFYFTDVLWPDFNRQDFLKAIVDFQKRERRFGKTGEQLNK